MTDIQVTAVSGNTTTVEVISSSVTYELTVATPEIPSVTVQQNVLTGPKGDPGIQGDQGIQGPAGPAGPGVPAGGNTTQILAKNSATDYDTEWIDYIITDYSPAFIKANSAFDLAVLAYDAANTADDQAIATAYNQANVAYDQANTAYNQANVAYNQANTSYNQANSAYDAANTSFDHASAAFEKANNALPLTGGDITGNVSIVGNLTLSGNTVIIEATRLQVDDPLIYLAGNNYTSDLVDIGFIANYVNATGANVHTGLYREHEDKMYYLFQGYDQEPRNNHIGALSNNMTLAVLNADLRTSNLELGGINAISWITSSYDKANLANQIAVSAFVQANLVYDQANSAFDLAALAYDAANTADDLDIARVFDQSNTAYNQANTAYNQANAAFSRANTGIYNSREINTNTILIPSDNKIFANGTINVELIVAASNVGKEFTITNIGTGIVTVLPNGSDKILSYDSMILENQWSSIILTSTGTNWVIS